MQRFHTVVVAGLTVAVLAGALFVPSALAQQAPPAPPRAEQCQSVLPSQTVDPILARYRDRLQSARDSVAKEQRAFRDLLIADSTTRAAIDAQSAKVNEARNALSRIQLDMLWELRSVVPAQNREQALRCAGRLFRRR